MNAKVSFLLGLLIMSLAFTGGTPRLAFDVDIYPVPQNAPCVSAGMNVPDSLQGQCPKATDVSPWYGVYKDKIIRFIVGASPGGSYDTYTRLIARSIGKYIPGNPTILVQNMTGAGMLFAAKYLHRKAKPTGLAAGILNNALIVQKGLGDPIIKINFRKLGWVGAPSVGEPLCMVMGFTGLKKLEDVLDYRKPLEARATRAGPTGHDIPLILNKVMETNFKVISGYRGTTPTRIALERHELEAFCSRWESMRVTARSIPDAEGDDKLIPFIVHSRGKDPENKDLPLLHEVIKGKKNLAMYNSWTAQMDFQRPFSVPPGTPKELQENSPELTPPKMAKPALPIPEAKPALTPPPELSEKPVELIPPELVKPLPFPAEAHLSRGPTWERKISLTFDGGSRSNATAEILDTLRANGVLATMFLTTQYIRRYPDLVRRMIQDGHEIGNHTFSHPHLTTYAIDGRHDTLPGVTKKFVQSELRQAARVFEEVTGRPMSSYWRAPYGEHNREIRRWAAGIGYLHVGWTRDPVAGEDLDTRDWVADPHSPLYYRVNQVRERILTFGKGSTARANGGIILLHLGTQRREDLVHRELGVIIDGLRRQGYAFVPVSELHRALALGEEGKGSAFVAGR